MTLEKKLKKHEEEKLKHEACRLSIKEGCAYSVMDGFGLRYITPYALALGANTTHIGLLNSIPLLLGSLAELPAIKAMKRYSRKTLVRYGTVMQAIMWLFIIGLGVLFFTGKINQGFAPKALIILFSILVTAGTAMHPVWTSWMKDIVPKKYNNYFGIRNKILGFVAVISMLIAGIILDFFKTRNLLAGFAIIFFIAFIGRWISSQTFLKKYEPKLKIKKNHELHFIPFIKKLTENNFGKFALFSSLMGMAVSIAAPFFAVYMLRNLELNYFEFTLISLSSLVVMFMTMPAWGKFADEYGNYAVLKITGFLIPLVPLVWLAAPLIERQYIVFYLIIAEAFSGLVWAGFILSSVDFIYDVADHEMIAPFMAYTSILNNFGIFIGATIGGWVASQSIIFLGFPAILVGFLISGLSRYAVAFGLLPQIKEVKRVKSFDFNSMKSQFIHMSFGKIGKVIR